MTAKWNKQDLVRIFRYKYKRYVASFLVFLMLVGLILGATANPGYKAQDINGHRFIDADQDGYLDIVDEEDILAIRNNPESGSDSYQASASSSPFNSGDGRNFELRNDITVNIKDMSSTIFTGEINGNGYTLTLQVTSDQLNVKAEKGNYGLLFGSITGKLDNMFINITNGKGIASVSVNYIGQYDTAWKVDEPYEYPGVSTNDPEKMGPFHYLEEWKTATGMTTGRKEFKGDCDIYVKEVYKHGSFESMSLIDKSDYRYLNLSSNCVVLPDNEEEVADLSKESDEKKISINNIDYCIKNIDTSLFEYDSLIDQNTDRWPALDDYSNKDTWNYMLEDNGVVNEDTITSVAYKAIRENTTNQYSLSGNTISGNSAVQVQYLNKTYGDNNNYTKYYKLQANATYQKTYCIKGENEIKKFTQYNIRVNKMNHNKTVIENRDIPTEIQKANIGLLVGSVQGKESKISEISLQGNLQAYQSNVNPSYSLARSGTLVGNYYEYVSNNSMVNKFLKKDLLPGMPDPKMFYWTSGKLPNDYKDCDDKNWSGYTDLNIGGFCGLLNGTISNCRQKVDVTATCYEGKPGGLTNVGGMTGYLESGGIADCWVEGNVSCEVNNVTSEKQTTEFTGGVAGFSAIEKINTISEDSAPIRNCMVNKERSTNNLLKITSLSDHGKTGVLYGDALEKFDAKNCYNISLSNKISDKTVTTYYTSGDFDPGTNWKLYTCNNQKVESYYVPKWLCRNGKFLYEKKCISENGIMVSSNDICVSMNSLNEQDGEEKTADDEKVNEFNFSLGGLWDEKGISEDKIVCLNDQGMKKISEGLTKQIGSSGHFTIKNETARDDKYYYFAENNASDRYVYDLGLSDTDEWMYQYNDVIHDMKSETDQVQAQVSTRKMELTGEIGINTEFYYKTADNNITATVSSNSVQIADDHMTAFKNFDYPDDDFTLSGSWKINGRYYPAIEEPQPRTYTLPEKLAVAEGSASAISYFVEGAQNANNEYTLTEENQTLSVNSINECYKKQKINIIPDDKICGKYTYGYYVGSEQESDLENNIKELKDKMITAGDCTVQYDGTPPIYNKKKFSLQMDGAVGEIKYLYILRMKDHYNCKPVKYKILIKDSLDMIESDVKNQEIVKANQKVHITPKSSIYFQGVRYLVVTDISRADKCLHGLPGVVDSEGFGSIEVKIPPRNNSETVYIFAQMYGTRNGQNICGSMYLFQYNYPPKCDVPGIDPYTISGTETKGIPTRLESGSQVSLESEYEKSTIVYSQDGTDLSSQVVEDENLINQLNTRGKSFTSEENGAVISYIYVNDTWYQVAGGRIYDDVSKITVTNYGDQQEECKIKAMTFAENREASDVVVYTYSISPIKQVGKPSPVLQSDEAVRFSYVSFISYTQGVQMYYTLNGSVPQIGSTSTFLYDADKGIRVTGDIGSDFTVNIFAVKRDAGGNCILKDSEVLTKTYKIIEEEKADMVTAVPEPSTEDNPVVLLPGEKILLLTSTVDATIFYSTAGAPTVVEQEDGTLSPGSQTFVYDDTVGIEMPDEAGKFFVIYAVAAKRGLSNSDVATLKYYSPEATLSPYATPASGKVSLNQNIILKNRTEGAIIYYEIAYDAKKPNDPTLSSAIYDEGKNIVITKKTTIKAIAVKDGVKSSVETFTYTPTEQLSAPIASISSGSIVPNGTMMTLSAPDKSTVYYTTDSSNPTDVSNKSVMTGNSVLIQGGAEQVVTIKACTKKQGQSTSEIAVYTYKISKYQGGVTADIESGATLSNGNKVNLITDVSEGTIYYSINGNDPVSGGTTGSVVTLTGTSGTNVTLKAVIQPTGGTVKTIAIFSYKLNEKPAPPSASPEGCKLSIATEVTLTAQGGKIYYTTDGSAPDIKAKMYTAPILITKSTTIKAVTISDAGEASEIATFIYTTSTKAEKPAADVAEGEIKPGTVVKLTTGTTNATIYYSTDGTDPELSNYTEMLVYGQEGICVKRNVTIKAVAFADGMQLSNVAEFSYIVPDVPADLAKKEMQKLKDEEELHASTMEGLTDRRAQQSISDNSYSDVVLKEDTYHTQIRSASNVISDQCELETELVKPDTHVIDNVKAVFGKEYTVLDMYEIKLKENDYPVEPDGMIHIGLPIPEGYEQASLSIVYVGPDNQIQKQVTKRDQNIAIADVEHLSRYALVGIDNRQSKAFRINFIYVLLGAAGYIVLFMIGYVMFTVHRVHKRREKRKAEHEELE